MLNLIQTTIILPKPLAIPILIQRCSHQYKIIEQLLIIQFLHNPKRRCRFRIKSTQDRTDKHKVPLNPRDWLLLILLINCIHMRTSWDSDLYSHIPGENNIINTENSLDYFELLLIEPPFLLLLFNQIIDVHCHTGRGTAVYTVYVVEVSLSGGWAHEPSLMLFYQIAEVWWTVVYSKGG